MIRVALAALLLLLTTPAVFAAEAPCTAAVKSCERSLELAPGERGILFATTDLERPQPEVRRAFILVHGALRNADRYFETANAAAFLARALGDTLVIAPAFHSADGQCHDALASGEVSWSCGRDSWRSGGAAASDPKLTSFGYMDAILDRLAERRLFPNLETVVIAGHSAGGQFVTRYEMAAKGIETLPFHVRFVVANPSSYAWPAPERLNPSFGAGTPQAAALAWKDEAAHRGFAFGPPSNPPAGYDAWPMGLQDRTGPYVVALSEEELRHNLVSRDAVYLLSQVDVLPLGGFDNSPTAMIQGATRRQRGEAFVDFLRQRYHVDPAVMIVPECGHNDRCVYTTPEVLPVIFPTP